MGSPKTPWRVAADQLLSDGEWHHKEAVIDVMASQIPSGFASRRRAAKLDHLRRSQGYDGSIDVSPMRDVEIGRRSVASDAINRATRHGAWQRDGDMIRLTPR